MGVTSCRVSAATARDRRPISDLPVVKHMKKPTALPKWHADMKSALKVACGHGWTVVNDRDRARLVVRDGDKKATLSLPFEFEAGTSKEVVAFVTQLNELVRTGEHSLDSAKAVLCGQAAMATTTAVSSDWDALKQGFEVFKKTNGTCVKDKTWALYERYLSGALQVLSGKTPPVRAFDLIDATVKALNLTTKARARKQCVEYLLQFLEWGMAHAALPSCWLLPAGQKKQLVGPKPKTQQKATLNDQTMLELIDSCPTPEWQNVLQMLAAFGLRPEELFHLSVGVNPTTGKEQFWCDYQKVSGEHRTAARWLFEVPLVDEDGNAVEWDLIERWKAGTLTFPPMADRGEALSQYLRRLPLWQRLRTEAAQQNQVLRPYVFRDSYALRGHLANVPTSVMCVLMGHSLQTHDKHYVTSSEETNAQVLERLFAKS